ncbi:hypothetical protein [Endozoicomonas sp. Mp262]|uniref:hypothetical protein n=1 Tax=Endozoicomonas sp. Mp262 TaxID=2919499 RepID=UPI0021DA2CC1
MKNSLLLLVILLGCIPASYGLKIHKFPKIHKDAYGFIPDTDEEMETINYFYCLTRKVYINDTPCTAYIPWNQNKNKPVIPPMFYHHVQKVDKAIGTLKYYNICINYLKYKKCTTYQCNRVHLQL